MKDFRQFISDAKCEGVKIPMFRGTPQWKLRTEIIRDSTSRAVGHDFLVGHWKIHVCMKRTFRLSWKYGLHVGPFHIQIGKRPLDRP